MPDTAVKYERVVTPKEGETRLVGEFETRDINEEKLQIEFVMSSFRRDDFGTRFDPNGVDISQYEKNPLVSFGHMRDGGIFRLPVGRGLVDTIHVDGDGKLRMVVEFTDEKTFEFGFQVYKLVKGGFLNMGSIAAEVLDEELIREADGSTTLVFKSWKLYDFSIVPLGANDDALVANRCKELGIDVDSLMDAERDIAEKADGEKDDKVDEVAEGLQEEGKKKKKPKKREDDEDEEGKKKEKSKEDLNVDLDCDVIGNAVSFTVRAKQGEQMVERKVYRSFEIKETDEQKKHRGYFEETQPALLAYRNLLGRMFERCGVVQPEDEQTAIAQLEVLYISPSTSENREKVVETRQSTPEDVTQLVKDLVPALAQAEREAIQNGLPLRKRPEFRKELIGTVLQSLSANSQ